MLQSSPTTAASHNPCYQREVIPQNPTLQGLWLTLVVERNRNRAGTFRSSYGLNFVKSQLGEVRGIYLPRTQVPLLGPSQARVPTLYDARGRLLHCPRGGTPSRDLPGTHAPDASRRRTP